MFFADSDLSDFTLILAHGELPPAELLRFYHEKSSFFIVLDGAFEWAIKNNIKPDIILGDLDCIHPKYLSSYNHKYYTDQESNDLEKAFMYCIENNFKRVLVLGAFGLRIDHFFTNIFALKKYAQDLEICLADEHQQALMCKAKHHIILEGYQDAFLSLFPLSPQAGPITTTGLAYPLSEEFLDLGERIGTLNKITQKSAGIYVEKGDVLLIMPVKKR